MDHSPTINVDERPNGATGKSFALMRTTARSFVSSMPTTVASYEVPSRIPIDTLVAPAITCALVTMMPSLRTTNPEPMPALRRSPVRPPMKYSKTSTGTLCTVSVCTVTTAGATRSTAAVIAVLRDASMDCAGTGPTVLVEAGGSVRACAFEVLGSAPAQPMSANETSRTSVERWVISGIPLSRCIGVKRGGIRHLAQRKPVGRRGRRRAGIVGCDEEPRDRTARTPPLSHCNHRSDEKTHHVMEKTVRRNFEHPAAVALDPPGMLNDAAVVIIDRRRVSDGKRTERVFAQHTIGFALERRRIERVVHRPLVPPTERGACRRIRPDKITISTRDGAPPCMKFRGHPMRLCHPDIVGEHRVHGPAERRWIPTLGHPDANTLAVRMDARIGSPGTDGRNGGRAEAREGHFHVALHGADDGLTLPAGEAPPVILRYQEDRSRVHDL